jgi:hypothetical protein
MAEEEIRPSLSLSSKLNICLIFLFNTF